jgi:Ca2+-transporting ATPase
VVARTMGLTTFALSNIWLALETSDEDPPMFSALTPANPMLLKTVALSFLAIVLTSELRILNRILDTVSLTLDQWLICVALSVSIIIVAEVKKLLRIRTTEIPPLAATEPAGATA